MKENQTKPLDLLEQCQNGNKQTNNRQKNKGKKPNKNKKEGREKGLTYSGLGDFSLASCLRAGPPDWDDLGYSSSIILYELGDLKQFT